MTAGKHIAHKITRILASMATIAMLSSAGVASDSRTGKAANPGSSSHSQNLPTPALWKIVDEDSQLYLFGTVHILRPDLDWRSEIVNEAFNTSDTIVFEAPGDTSNPQKSQAMIVKYGVNPPGVTLSSQLSVEGNQRLEAALAQLGMAVSRENFEPLRPWLAGVTLAALQIQSVGGDPNAGVERILGAEALNEGKTIRHLESDEQQMQILSGLSPAAEIYFLEEGLRQTLETPGQINDLVAYWKTGDMHALEELLVSSMAGQDELYAALLVNRNRNWARQIEQLLDGSGTIFVAVGAAHLVGEQSVQVYLASKGLAAVRQ